MPDTSIYTVRKGDSAWLIAQRRVIGQGKKATNSNIAAELQSLIRLNSCESVEDFNQKFFSSVGNKIVTEDSNVKKPKPQGKTTEVVETDNTPAVQNTERKMVSKMNSVEKIKEDITASGGKPVEIPLNKLSSDMRVKVESYMNLFEEAHPTIVKDQNSGEVFVYMNTLNSVKGNKAKLQSLNIKLDKGNTVVTRYYRTGKIAQDIENNYDSSKNRSVLIQGPYKKQGAKKVIKEPLDIQIELNSDIYKNATSSQKKSINKFLGSLQSNKASLMEDLGIDNDTYNRFAKLAVAIGMQETKLGTATSYDDWESTSLIGGAKDSLAYVNSKLKEAGINNPIKYGGLNSTSVSKGITQIKVGDWMKSPRIKELFAKYGITSGYYSNPTEEQSAAATIIVLNELSKRVKQPEYKDGIDAANKKFYAVDVERDKNGKIIHHKTKKWKLNTVTEDDAILYLYNGRYGVLKNGNATPKDNAYVANIRRNAACVKVYEDASARAKALQKADTVLPEDNSERAQKKMKDDLGWGIGQVAFKPALYTSGVENNTDKEIEILKSTLKAKGIDNADIEKIARLMKNGDIAFVKGLTRREASAMTDADVKLIIQHSERLDNKLANVKTDATKRKYASAADKNFKRAYLSSHASQTSLSAVKKSSVKLNKSADNQITPYPSRGYYTGAQRRCEGLLPQLRGNHTPDAGYHNSKARINDGKYVGFSVEKDNGINHANASKTDILLAKNGADAANTLRTNGACLTGVKQALIGSGAVSVSEMKTFNKAYQLAGFLSSHPERFIEITHIQISPKKAREITAGDLSSLPAGCIVVFGNRSRADVDGHSGITNGHAQIYSDEVDNCNWDNFVSDNSDQNGKGEHGYIRVFRLNPAYFTVDEAGKKLVKK